MPARRLVEIPDADDVGLEDRRERAFGRDAAEVDDGVAARDERVERRGVLQRGDDDLFAVVRFAERRDVADAQHAGEPAQARPQDAAEATGRAGQEKAREGRRERGRPRAGWRRWTRGDRRRALAPRPSSHLLLQRGSVIVQLAGFVSLGTPMNLPPLTPQLPARRPRNLAIGVVDALADRIRDGSLACGAKLATESALMAEFGVSRTVIREALSKLQAAALVQTRHGVGTFVTHGGIDSAVFRIRPDQLETLHDVVAMLELRIGVETEAAGLAAQRRTQRRTSPRCGAPCRVHASGGSGSRRSGP